MVDSGRAAESSGTSREEFIAAKLAGDSNNGEGTWSLNTRIKIRGRADDV